MRFLSLFLLGFGLSASEQCFAITNQVAREIYREGDSVKVQDRIWLPLRRSQHLGGLGRILEAKSESTENLSREIEKFYKGEDLSVERFELSTNDSKFVLAVTSRVVFPATSVATLQLSPTYCGSLRPDPADSKDAEPLVRIISAGKHKYLLFPEWRLPDDDKLGLATVTNLLHLDSIVQEAMQLRSDLRIQCRLRVEEGESAILFDYQPDTSALNRPNASLIEHLQSLHALSGNDLRTLFTKVKLAKPGFYAIGVNNYSNQDPIDYNQKPALTSTVKPSKRTPSIKIDGKYDEWLSAQTVVLDNRDAVQTNPYRFNVTSISYLSDDEYFYFFIKFTPDVETRFKELSSARSAGGLGGICRIVCDTDLDLSTGSPDTKEEPKGSDFGLRISAGSSVLISGKDNFSARPYVACTIEKWDMPRRDFVQGTKYVSTDDLGLISWGTEGVELAVARAQFGKLSGADIELISIESTGLITQIAVKAKTK